MQESSMAIPLGSSYLRMGMEHRSQLITPPVSTPPTWTIDVSDVRTIKVSNISPSATANGIKEFFSFSGEIMFIEMRRESETSQVAYVTFKELHGADTALLLSGASIFELSMNITSVEDYELPPEAYKQTLEEKGTPAEGAVRKAEDVVSSMLAKGYALSNDALKRARSFDERHHLLSTATARVASLDHRLGLSQKLSLGTAAVREVGELLQVSEMTRCALATAEKTASSAGTALMGNPYVSRGAAWVSGALRAVARAAVDVGVLTMEKVGQAE